MKRWSCLKLAGVLTVLSTAIAAPASNEGGNIGQASGIHRKNTEHFTGTVKSVDPEERTLQVMTFWTTRSFNLTDHCQVTLESKEGATLADLIPGHRVDVTYQEVGGVRVADKVEQRDLRYEGKVMAINHDQRTMSVKRGWTTREFKAPKDGGILFADGTQHPLADLEVGKKVEVRYITPEEDHLALKVEILNLQFTGRIEVLDADKQLINAGNLVASHTFQLSDDCQFEIPGTSDGSIKDLQIGDRVTFEYEDIDGVPVATRVILNPAGQAANDRDGSSGSVANQ